MWVGVAVTQGGPGDDFSAVVRASSCILAEVQLVELNLSRGCACQGPGSPGALHQKKVRE